MKLINKCIGGSLIVEIEQHELDYVSIEKDYWEKEIIGIKFKEYKSARDALLKAMDEVDAFLKTNSKLISSIARAGTLLSVIVENSKGVKK